ncbi:Uncharacterized protein C8E11.05c [Candida viswanathii]|uniref:Uncharacterized protein C8E11.05c n=1 Tax=Candida viswanathii TaxID=5486 RepID=A0A367YPG1_9ASCO|nr:Uncharacterized protein C8E11.05c [Candida viswanathii]
MSDHEETSEIVHDDTIDVVDEYLPDDEHEEEEPETTKEHVNNEDIDQEELKPEEEPQAEEDEDDDFDDFNEADFQAANHNQHEQEDDDDDDFGDFDDVEYHHHDNNNHAHHSTPALPTSIFSNPKEFSIQLDSQLNDIFPTPQSTPQPPSQPSLSDTSILNERSEIIYKQVSNMPYLQPSNWIKSNIRHNLLIKLGIPINLDELNPTTTTTTTPSTTTTGTTASASLPGTTSSISEARRRSSISAADIDWTQFAIPKLDDMGLDADARADMIKNTGEVLARVEVLNLLHISEQFLRDASNKEVLDEKLDELTRNYDELIKLSAVWLGRIDDLKGDFEIYENVVQSFIGYSQKLRRDEIFENLKKLKHTKKKKKLWNK